MPHILWFPEITKHDVHLVGGKGANLGEMTQAGIRVPEGFMVTAETFVEFISTTGIDKAIYQLLENIDCENTTLLMQISERIKTIITSTDVPTIIHEAIIEAYSRVKPLNAYVAVRSSATAEDLPGASFAGQQATFLNVQGAEQVVYAVRACWASLFESRAIYYRNEKHFDHQKVSIAVVVQRMVHSEKSGVMFSVNPITLKKNELMIEAAWGLGETVVSGAVNPDEYIVDTASMKITEKTLNRQTWQLVRQPEETKQSKDLSELNQKVAIPEEVQQRQKISDTEILELARVGKLIEQHYNYPQDMEWAIEDGAIYIVQSRPITTLGDDQPALQQGESPKMDAQTQSQSSAQGEILLRGAAASPGIRSGKVIIIHDPKEIDKVQAGDILVSPMTTPDFVPAMKKAVAIITDLGGRTCHAAIVSRELGVPCVVGTQEATKKLINGQEVTVDGSKGIIYSGLLPVKTNETPVVSTVATTSSGSAPLITATKVYVNLASPDLAEQVAARDTDGIGLLRAEFIIADIGEHPRKLLKENRGQEFTDKLAVGVGHITQAMYPRPVIYRTTDFKTNEYRNLKGGEEYEFEESNPMIGYRGCSRYLNEPDVFRIELAAIKKLRSQGLTNLHVMIPFVRTVSEMAGVMDFMAEEGLEQSQDFKIWMMCEVPSNVLLIEEFCHLGIDGVSIGSNDLTQLVLGVDRDSEVLGSVFDERNEAVMMAIERVITKCHEHEVTVSICGQGPSVYPELTEKLVSWGIDSVSVNPDMIEHTRKIIARSEQKLLLSHARKSCAQC